MSETTNEPYDLTGSSTTPAEEPTVTDEPTPTVTDEPAPADGTVDEEAAAPASSLVDRNFYYPTELDPARRIPGTSPYLDRVQREEAEIQRAKIEDREPNLVNPPAMQSTPLIGERQAAGLLSVTPLITENESAPLLKDQEPDVVLPVSVVTE